MARYMVQHAEDVLSVFEQAVPDYPRTRAAIDAAWRSSTAPRGRDCSACTSLHAHGAVRAAPSAAAGLATRSAGDAAYLHPIAKTGQGGHIVRASASAAHIGEVEAGGNPVIGDAMLERSRQRATPVLIDVLRRYPPATSGSNRVAQLMSTLDHSLRQAIAGRAIRRVRQRQRQSQSATHSNGYDRSPGHTALSRADAQRRECKS